MLLRLSLIYLSLSLFRSTVSSDFVVTNVLANEIGITSENTHYWGKDHSMAGLQFILGNVNFYKCTYILFGCFLIDWPL